MNGRSRTSDGPRRDGQSGLTMVELLITISVSAIVLFPLFALTNQVLLQRKPTIEAAESSKQLRLFRSTLAQDWTNAEQIVLNPPAWPASNADCNGPGPNAGPSTPSVAAPIKVAIVTSFTQTSQILGADVTYRQRILYQLRNNGDGTSTITRRVCQHRLSNPSDLNSAWELGGRTDAVQTFASGLPSQTPPLPIGSNQVMLKSVRDMVLPAAADHGCSTTPTGPYPPCDVNVTVVGLDGDRNVDNPYDPTQPYRSSAQRTTIRLHQQVGPTS